VAQRGQFSMANDNASATSGRWRLRTVQSSEIRYQSSELAEADYPQITQIPQIGFGQRKNQPQMTQTPICLNRRTRTRRTAGALRSKARLIIAEKRVRLNIGWNIRLNTRPSIRASLPSSLRSNLRASLRSNLRSSLRASLRSSFRSNLRANLRSSLRSNLRLSLLLIPLFSHSPSRGCHAVPDSRLEAVDCAESGT